MWHGTSTVPATWLIGGTTDVTHIKTTEVSKDPAGAVVESWTSEFWIDPNTEDARYEQRDSDGTLHLREARSGLSDSVFYPDENHVETQTAVVDSTVDGLPGFVHNVENQVYGYKNALLSKEIVPQPVRDGEDVITDNLGVQHKTVVVEVTYTSDGDGEIDLIRALLDAKDLLPLKETAYRYGELGGLVEVGTHYITYTLIETVPRSQLPQDFFVLSGSSVATVTHQRFMTPLTAKEFTEFGIYWVGPSAGTLPLDSIYQDERKDASGRLSQVSVIYGRSEGDMLGIIQGVPPTANETGNRGEPERTDPGEAVTVAGGTAALYDEGNGTVRLEFTIGGTFITIEGSSRDQVLQASQLLRKLN
jgi:hypothetical protein